MNNKGFAVSAVLYTLLIAFLLFLAAALAMFSSSNSLISNANSDIVNGNPFSAEIKKVTSGDVDSNSYYKKMVEINGITYGKNTIIQIKSKYGIKYWPNDFSKEGVDNWSVKLIISSDTNFDCGNLKVKYTSTSNTLTITDTSTNESILLPLP